MKLQKQRNVARALMMCVAALILPVLSACGASEPPPVTPTVEDGWNLYTQQKDGFGLALPSNWEQWDLNTLDLKTAFSNLRERNPQLASALSGKVANLAVQGVKFFALDQDALYDGDSFVTNVNVIKQNALLISPDLDSVTEQSITELKSQFGSALSSNISKSNLTINGRPARRIDYDMELNMPGSDGRPMSVVQFIATRDKSIYIVTCTTTTEAFGYYISTFDKIGQSLWLFPSE